MADTYDSANPDRLSLFLAETDSVLPCADSPAIETGSPEETLCDFASEVASSAASPSDVPSPVAFASEGGIPSAFESEIAPAPGVPPAVILPSDFVSKLALVIETIDAAPLFSADAIPPPLSSEIDAVLEGVSVGSRSPLPPIATADPQTAPLPAAQPANLASVVASLALATLQSQGLDFESCDITMTDSQATAYCRGTLPFVRKVGNSIPLTADQEWTFKMRRLGGNWRIDEVATSQTSVMAAHRVRGKGLSARELILQKP